MIFEPSSSIQSSILWAGRVGHQAKKPRPRPNKLNGAKASGPGREGSHALPAALEHVPLRFLNAS